MGNVTYDCPYCTSATEPYSSNGLFHFYNCEICKNTWACGKDSTPKYVIVREDSNKHFTSETQAIKVAEKLALENPTHTYFIGKIIYKSKAVSAITTKVE